MTISKYAVKDFIEPQRAVQDLKVNEHNLDLSMMTHAGQFAYYASLAAKAQFQMDQLEQLRDIVAARLDKKIRDAAVVEGRKVTEAQVKAEIALEPDTIAINTAVNKAKMVAAVCKSHAEAFRQRKDMLVSMAINNREEKKGELRVHDKKDELNQQIRHDRQVEIQRKLSQQSP